MKSITPERILLCLLIPFLTGCSGMTKLAAAQIERNPILKNLKSINGLRNTNRIIISMKTVIILRMKSSAMKFRKGLFTSRSEKTIIFG